MENALDALQMAFAVFALVIALSVSTASLSQARQASDYLISQQDKTNFYKYVDSDEQNRVVGLETIIPTLHKYYKENYTVVFKTADSFDFKTGMFTNWQNMIVYYSGNATTNKTNIEQWGSTKRIYDPALGSTKIENSYDTLFKKKYDIDDIRHNNKYVQIGDMRGIFSFDTEEEDLRHEPWVGDNAEYEKNINAFLSGGTYRRLSEDGTGVTADMLGQPYIEYSKKKDTAMWLDGGIDKHDFSNYFAGEKFIETIGEYTKDTSADEKDESGNSKLTSLATSRKTYDSKKKRIIIFTHVDSANIYNHNG